ncbi:hypothetical protein EYC80_009861 [Monilinia laxa]|uniref:Uncharacterized protein n=1 Tax=Monilinia laxa TaxID=61186 RepID=A0A5N6JQW5_MONLA|nr:hypothetical protein EYC80_009861 [Monilinia laxa]
MARLLKYSQLIYAEDLTIFKLFIRKIHLIRTHLIISANIRLSCGKSGKLQLCPGSARCPPMLTTQMEGAELSSALQKPDDSFFIDLTISPTLPSANLISDSTDYITTENHFPSDDTLSDTDYIMPESHFPSDDTLSGTDYIITENQLPSFDTLPDDVLSSGSPEILEDSISIMCTIKFNDLYYFDMQVSDYHPDNYFDLTQDPEKWAHMCTVSPHNEREDSPNRYIDHCLNLMWNKNGNCKDIIGVLVFAWFIVDKKDTWNFWDRLWHLAMKMIDFKHESGRSISYLGRIELPGGLKSACWNHALQEFLEDEGYWGSSALFKIDEKDGLRWIKPTEEEEEIMTNSDSFAENWVVELPRNEYYW